MVQCSPDDSDVEWTTKAAPLLLLWEVSGALLFSSSRSGAGVSLGSSVVSNWEHVRVLKVLNK